MAEEQDLAWPSNYFNYFTEVEEHFQRVRGTGLFLMSPLDWALIETWKDAGVPLEAVLRGIDAAFEKWRQRKNRRQAVNSLAYCTQAVMAEAEILAGTAKPTRDRVPVPGKEAAVPFDLQELQSFLTANAAHLRTIDGYGEIATALDKLIAEAESHYHDLEQLEQRLTALEDKMSAIARARQSDDDLFQARRELDSQLRPYRGKMTAEQLSMLERQYLARRLFESAGLPRLSLFYLR
jgi:hypothetical protein